jgi:hypothetical protein
MKRFVPLVLLCCFGSLSTTALAATPRSQRPGILAGIRKMPKRAKQLTSIASTIGVGALVAHLGGSGHEIGAAAYVTDRTLSNLFWDRGRQSEVRAAEEFLPRFINKPELRAAAERMITRIKGESSGQRLAMNALSYATGLTMATLSGGWFPGFGGKLGSALLRPTASAVVGEVGETLVHMVHNAFRARRGGASESPRASN